jgi:acetolactate synthase-1/2/3 large subunit
MPRRYKARIGARLSFEETQNGSIETTGAGAILAALRNEGVDVVFGYPGGAVLPLYDALYDQKDIHHVLVRHEQGAAHMADGYARVTGKVGVCIATSGPGATNTVTGIANACMDSVPLVVLTGQVRRTLLGKDSFQEADITGITIPITKQNVLVTDVEDLGPAIAEAFFIARGGRPGPVLVDVPVDLQLEKVVYRPQRVSGGRGLDDAVEDDPEQIEAAATAISGASQPLLYCGGGVIIGNATDEVREFAEFAQIPVAYTLMGKGSVPEEHPLALGMLGMHGTVAANYAMQGADCVIAVGARFDDRVTGKLDEFLPNAKSIVHIDIDPSELGKIVPATHALAGDVKRMMGALTEAVRAAGTPDTADWLWRVAGWKRSYPLSYNKDGDGIRPQDIPAAVEDLYQGECIVVTDVGQHQMWAAQYCKMRHPRRWVTSGGLGTMGYGLPAAIGAKIGRPDMPVVCISGDGSFQMCAQELTTAVEQGIPITIAISNNRFLGMVRQWQEMFYRNRYSHSSMVRQPDFVKLAEAHGCRGWRVEHRSEMRDALEWAARNEDVPTVLDCMVEPEENVYPMVPAGKPIHEIICDTGVRD